MPAADNRGVSLYYENAGSGPTVAFVNDAGYGAWLWGWQHRALAGPYETLVWDLRGTGRSDAPPGPYDVGGLAADLEAVLADHGARRVHLVGAGLGGMVALAHAREYGRTRTLSLFGTAPSGATVDEAAVESLFAPPDDPTRLRESLRPAFAPGVIEDHPGTVERIVAWREADDADREGWEAQVAALRGFDAGDWLHEVTVPALVGHGRADAVVPPGAGEALARDLPRGEFRAFDGGHLFFVAAAQAANDALLAFLDEHA